MNKRRVLALWIAVAASIGLVIASVATAAGQPPVERPLHGAIHDIANFGGPGCGSPTGVCSSFTITGSINGSGVVSVDTFPSAHGISQAHTVIHTRFGDLTCSESAIFDLTPESDHAWVDLCVITGGTGRYAGASGYIQEVGTFDFAANLGQANYYGELSLADG